jgi:hypothetical protein
VLPNFTARWIDQPRRSAGSGATDEVATIPVGARSWLIVSEVPAGTEFESSTGHVSKTLINAAEFRGWGTWIRTKAARSRAGSSTAKLSPTGSVERGNTTPHPASATLPNRRGLRRNHVACGDSANQRLCGSGGLRDHARLSACAAKIALTVRANPSCHGGSRRPNTAANLPQSRRESAGRFALVGHSSVAIGAIVGTSTP